MRRLQLRYCNSTAVRLRCDRQPQAYCQASNEACRSQQRLATILFVNYYFLNEAILYQKYNDVVVWRLQPLLCLKILSYSNRSWIVVVITAFVAAWVGRFVHTIVGVGLSVYPHENSTTNQASATKPGTQVDLGPVARVLLFWGWKVKGQVHTIKNCDNQLWL